MRALLVHALALMAVTLPLSGPRAAPQILAVIASNGAVPLHCAGGACRAELSSFCLQEDRPVPAAGTTYKAVAGEGIALIVNTADGERRSLPAPDGLRFISERNYTAVTVSLPAQELARLGAVSAAVEIGEGVTLLPLPVAGDQRPQSDADVAIALAARRTAGTELVDSSDGAATARTLGRIVNALSPEAHASVTPRDRLWRDAVEHDGAEPEAPGLSRAAGLYRSCTGRPGRDSDAALRWCLQLRHDALILELNGAYWDALEAGS